MPADEIGPAEGGSRVDLVIGNVKRLIAAGELSAGDRLPIEKDLAERWGVSRGSLREGVRALATLGVLETRQGDGTYVTDLDPEALLRPLGFFADLQGTAQAADLLAVRRVLEAESVGLAARKLTDEQIDQLEAILAPIDALVADGSVDPEAFIDADMRFHQLISRAGGNPALAALVDGLMTRTFRGRLWRALTERDSVGVAHAEHRLILDALRARDPERARIRMLSHLLGVEEFAAAHAPVVEPSASDAAE